MGFNLKTKVSLDQGYSRIHYKTVSHTHPQLPVNETTNTVTSAIGSLNPFSSVKNHSFDLDFKQSICLHQMPKEDFCRTVTVSPLGFPKLTENTYSNFGTFFRDYPWITFKIFYVF